MALYCFINGVSEVLLAAKAECFCGFQDFTYSKITAFIAEIGILLKFCE